MLYLTEKRKWKKISKSTSGNWKNCSNGCNKYWGITILQNKLIGQGGTDSNYDNESECDDNGGFWIPAGQYWVLGGKWTPSAYTWISESTMIWTDTCED
mgnify:CR=1 FL=1